MVKKKRQTDPHDDESTTESCDEKLTNTSGSIISPGECGHITKSVDRAKLRKVFKSSKLESEYCSECSKTEVITPEDATGDDVFEYDKTLWLCLKCGSQLCGRSRNKHALQHYKTPRSDSHSLTINTKTFEVWCYTCDNEVNPASRKNLIEVIDMIKKLSQQQSLSPEENNGISNIENKIVSAFDTMRPLLSDQLSLNNYQRGSTNSTNGAPKPGFAQRVQTIDPLPRVRGLSNLGNTCFFNAVLQCLAQTPYLLEVLRESSVTDEKFELPGGTFKFTNGQETELEPIKGTLSSWGGLTSALAEALEQLQSGGGVFEPSKLFHKLSSKCPQFRGGDQHDSHELLRHLLESVRSEDLQRYQKVILEVLGYNKEDIKTVPDEMKQKCKIYGQQAADRILRPEQVFRGFLVSTLTCQDCYHTSSCHENFLDLSLPVSVEKPQPPIRRKSSPEPSSSGPSKHQLKKEKEKERKSKRAQKHHNKRAAAQNLFPSIGPANDSQATDVPVKDNENNSTNSRSSSSSSSEQSDADVEDNLVDDVPKYADSTQQINNKITTPFYDPNGNSEIPSSLIGPEKRGDSPENPNKDSNDDENDSGIATSPGGNTTTLENPTLGGKTIVQNNNMSKDNKKTNNCVLERGISKEGATIVRQWTLSPDDESYKPPTTELEQLTLKENCSFLAAKHKAKTKRIRTQSHSDWNTTIAPRYQCEDGECSIQSCLNNFTAVELMTGNNKVGCDACTKHINGEGGKTINTNATKQFLISSPPAVLILHLKRFQVGPRCMFQKLKRPVSFSMLLDIAPFCGSKVKNLPNIDRKQKKLLYALYGIVEHTGSMHGGHYIAYVKVRPKIAFSDRRWKFLPHGSKAELDQTDEQRAKLDELLAREKARELRMKDNDSDDYSSANSSVSEAEEPEIEGAVGGCAAGDPNMEPPPGKWYSVSDSFVHEVSEEKVLNAQAYLLFYERIY